MVEETHMTDTEREIIKSLCMDGLRTDGAHHKQWFLEEILKALGCNLEEVRQDRRVNGYEWEEGIAR